MEEMKKYYELVFILSPQLDEAALESTKKEIKETLNKFEGEIEFKQTEKKELAYPINKQGRGIFIISQLSIVPDNVNNFSKELKLNKRILRHLISQLPLLRAETKKIKPSPKKTAAIKKKIADKKKKDSSVKTLKDKAKLEEIDKKLNEIIEEI